MDLEDLKLLEKLIHTMIDNYDRGFMVHDPDYRKPGMNDWDCCRIGDFYIMKGPYESKTCPKCGWTIGFYSGACGCRTSNQQSL